MAERSAEARWRQEVMADAKMALACGDTAAAYSALTRHEQEGYPWAPGAPSNRGPDVAHAHTSVEVA
jgi:hypothetical protein